MPKGRKPSPVKAALRNILGVFNLPVSGKETTKVLLQRFLKAREKATKEAASATKSQTVKKPKAQAKVKGGAIDKKKKKSKKKLICQMSAKEYLAKCGGDISKCRPQPRLMGDGTLKLKVVRVKPGKTPQWVNKS